MHETSSNTHSSEDISDKALAKQWRNIRQKDAVAFVNRLQTRIAKAVKEGKYRLAKRLQYLLTNSYYGKVVAVKKVSGNRGKKTPGIDGE